MAGSREEDAAAHLRTTTTDSQTEEHRLVAAAKAGDKDAYASLLRRHQEVAFRAAYLVSGSRSDAEDATQEACVKAWLALDRFREQAPFRPWLVRIAINEARNRRRGAGRRDGLTLRLADDPPGTIVAPAAEDEALAADQRSRLAAQLGLLSEDDQLVIAARYLLGLSESETATALALRVGTVKSRLSRALERLREQLEEPR
ncbi:MAG TPA: RNA polymerase sigma factor [Solirubrobacteraceae bacterium]